MKTDKRQYHLYLAIKRGRGNKRNNKKKSRSIVKMDLDCCLDFIYFIFFIWGDGGGVGGGGGGGNRSQFYNQIKTRHVFMEMTMKCRHALQI